jgi:hypothetical protein
VGIGKTALAFTKELALVVQIQTISTHATLVVDPILPVQHFSMSIAVSLSRRFRINKSIISSAMDIEAFRDCNTRSGNRPWNKVAPGRQKT